MSTVPASVHTLTPSAPPTLQSTCLLILEGGGPELSDLAASLLLRLLRGLKRSLALSASTQYVVAPYPAAPAASAGTQYVAPLTSAPAASSTPEDGAAVEGSGNPGGASGAGAGAGAGVGAGGPSGSSSSAAGLIGTRLPRALPEVPEGQRGGAALARFCEGVVDVSTLAFAICSRVGKGWGRVGKVCPPTDHTYLRIIAVGAGCPHTPRGCLIPFLPRYCPRLTAFPVSPPASPRPLTHQPLLLPLQVFSLLRNPERHFQLLPLVEELLPLLLVTRDGALGSVSEQVCEWGPDS